MPTSELNGRAFPKISGKATEFINHLKALKRAGKLSTASIDIEGTVKLHGMHVDIVFSPASPDSHAEIVFQSRNKVCAADASQHGWPSHIAQYNSTLITLKNQILARYTKFNKQVNFYPDQALIIVAGEWIGHKVQKGVGISELSHRFVILTVQINGVWQHDLDYADIEAPEAAIYNVQRVPTYHVLLDCDDLTINNPALLQMQQLADEVEKCCPFAEVFGIQNSMGEGIVWKPNVPEARYSAKYWLKTKGPLFGPENRILPATDNTLNMSLTAGQAARKWLTNRRVEQGFEYLNEMQVTRKSQYKVFKQWVIDDILVEERGEIADLTSQQSDFQKDLQQHLARLLSDAFNSKLRAQRPVKDMAIAAISKSRPCTTINSKLDHNN